jgi:hypothetical protein
MKKIQNKAKIIRVSRIIRHLLFAGVVLWSIGIPLVVGQCLFGHPTVTGWDRMNLQVSAPVVMIIELAANFRLFRFFDRLQRGYLFDAETVANLHAAGQWCVLLWLAEVYHTELRHWIFSDEMSWAAGLGVFFAGIVLIFFAWLLKEAQGLQEEQELTV